MYHHPVSIITNIRPICSIYIFYSHFFKKRNLEIITWNYLKHSRCCKLRLRISTVIVCKTSFCLKNKSSYLVINRIQTTTGFRDTYDSVTKKGGQHHPPSPNSIPQGWSKKKLDHPGLQRKIRRDSWKLKETVD